jgi:hypothetical protein
MSATLDMRTITGGRVLISGTVVRRESEYKSGFNYWRYEIMTKNGLVIVNRNAQAKRVLTQQINADINEGDCVFLLCEILHLNVLMYVRSIMEFDSIAVALASKQLNFRKSSIDKLAVAVIIATVRDIEKQYSNGVNIYSYLLDSEAGLYRVTRSFKALATQTQRVNEDIRIGDTVTILATVQHGNILNFDSLVFNLREARQQSFCFDDQIEAIKKSGDQFDFLV